MKVVILFAGGLLVGTAAGTVGRAMTMDLPPVEGEVVDDHSADAEAGSAVELPPEEGASGFVNHEADTGTSADGAPGMDGSQENASEPGQPADAVGDASTSGQGATLPPAATQQPAVTPPPGASGLGAQGAAGDIEPASVRMSQIFGAMDAKAAASVLVELSDGEVQEILQHLSARKTSAIIKAMPPERAATLSRVMMMDGGDA